MFSALIANLLDLFFNLVIDFIKKIGPFGHMFDPNFKFSIFRYVIILLEEKPCEFHFGQ